MSIAEIAAGARIQRTDVKLATLDIERLPGIAEVQHRGLTIRGDFWDLNSWKHLLGYRIHPDSVIEWPTTILACWKWYGTKTVHSAAVWDDGGADGMHQKLWDVCDQASIVSGHNVDNFDLKKLRSGWWLMGLPEPSTFKTVDTLKEARKALGEESNTLDALCKRAGLVAKTDKYRVEVARDAVAGVAKAQKQITAYCKGDVIATEGFADSLRGRMPGHPHLGNLDESEERCNQCGSSNLEVNGTHLAIQIRYRRYRCLDCGANLRGAQHSRAANVRGAR